MCRDKCVNKYSSLTEAGSLVFAVSLPYTMPLACPWCAQDVHTFVTDGGNAVCCGRRFHACRNPHVDQLTRAPDGKYYAVDVSGPALCGWCRALKDVLEPGDRVTTEVQTLIDSLIKCPHCGAPVKAKKSNGSWVCCFKEFHQHRSSTGEMVYSIGKPGPNKCPHCCNRVAAE